MIDESSFGVTELTKLVDPISYYLIILKSDKETSNDVIQTIRHIKKFMYQKETNTVPLYRHLVETDEKVNELKAILDNKYSIEKYPEYWI